MLSLDTNHMCFVQCLTLIVPSIHVVPLNEQRVTVGGCGGSGGSRGAVVQASLQGLLARPFRKSCLWRCLAAILRHTRWRLQRCVLRWWSDCASLLDSHCLGLRRTPCCCGGEGGEGLVAPSVCTRCMLQGHVCAVLVG